MRIPLAIACKSATAERGRASDYRFAFSMGFADEAAYAAYNEHPAHTAFVSERWVPEVADFQEIDVVAL